MTTAVTKTWMATVAQAVTELAFRPLIALSGLEERTEHHLEVHSRRHLLCLHRSNESRFLFRTILLLRFFSALSFSFSSTSLDLSACAACCFTFADFFLDRVVILDALHPECLQIIFQLYPSTKIDQ